MSAIVNTRDTLLSASATRVVTNTIGLTSTSGRFMKQKDAAGTIPASMTLTASTTGYATSALLSWEYALNTTPNTWVAISSSLISVGTTLIVSNTDIDSYIGVSTANTVYFKCTITQSLKPTMTAQYFVDYYIEPQDGIIGVDGDPGPPGAEGSKSVTVMAYKWSNTVISVVPTQAFTYNWTTGAVSANPSTWTSSAPSSPGTGYTLYTLMMPISTNVSNTGTSSHNWSSSYLNVFGYTEKGDIGLSGIGQRTAYTVTTSGTPPTGIIANGALPPSGPGTWSFTATSTLTEGQFMYQVDGTLNSAGTLITWGLAYLSNLKVGSLSAISANLGIVDIATAGNLHSGKTAYGSGTGFYLGNDAGTPKFDIGNTTNYMRWNGTSLSIVGGGTFTGDITGTLNSTAVSTVVSNASTALTNASTAQSTANTAVTNASTAQSTANTAVTNAATAQSTANAKLAKAGDTITGRINLAVADGLFAGTDLNNGVYLGNGGLVGKKAGVTTFAVDTAGNASFAGTLSGSVITGVTGTFAGSLSGATITGATGTFSGSLDVKSAASGARTEIKSNVIKVFDSSGVLRVQLGDLSA